LRIKKEETHLMLHEHDDDDDDDDEKGIILWPSIESARKTKSGI
jgi:hypothetical protein